MSEWAEIVIAAVDSNDCSSLKPRQRRRCRLSISTLQATDISPEAIANRLECQRSAQAGFHGCAGSPGWRRSFLEILTPMQVFRYCSGGAFVGATSNESSMNVSISTKMKRIEKVG